TNPSDGDEVYYQVYVNGQLSGNTGYWHLRYNASTGYWDFLGGPALSSTDSTVHSTASTSYLSSNAYDYLPLNGDYDVSYGSELAIDAANALNQMQVGLTQTGTTVHTCYFVAVSQFNGSSLNCSTRVTGVTGAGGTNRFVQDLYMSLSGQSSNFYPLYVNVTPIRVK
ncbi:MAG TPA: hypothetical protein VHA05_01505, partial [Candidatus Saccharimonadales bacterium]|nr:hypothetical protein [Candidatus Saccharimonadales bacterium]